MFWKGVVGYLPVNIVQALAGFGTIYAFTRLLTPEAYGDYALAFAVASLTHTLMFTWVEAAMARFYVTEPAGEPRARLYATLYTAFGVMSVALPLVAGAILALAPLSASLRVAVFAGLASVIARSLLKMVQERRRAAGEVKGYALIDITQSGGGFALGALFAALGLGGAAPLAGVGAACAVCLVWTLAPEVRVARQGRFDPQRLEAYVRYGAPVSFSLVFSLAIANTDRFVIAAFMGEGAVGAYHAGYSLANRTLDVMFIWLGMAGGPAAVAALERGGHTELQRTANDQFELMSALALPAAAGLALVALPLAQVMIGKALAVQAAHVTPWIALSALFAGLTTYYFHTAFTLARRTGLLLAAMAVPAAANLALTLALIPRFGLDGAMIATALAYGIGLVASFSLGRRAIALPVPLGALARAGTATAAMALAVANLPAMGGLLELFEKAGVGVVVYALAALALDVMGCRSRGLGRIAALKPRLAA